MWKYISFKKLKCAIVVNCCLRDVIVMQVHVTIDEFAYNVTQSHYQKLIISALSCIY